MNLDFTIGLYKTLLETLELSQKRFISFSDYRKKEPRSSIVLRHDVDQLPQNSLYFAQIQSKLRIRGSYYFRAVPESWNERVIKEIADLGHEVGYHYESLNTCKGNMEEAIKDFELNLKNLRKIVPVETICMHGSPLSPYDSRDLWKQYSYSDYGIIGEPYFDVDFSKVLYLTDTGRRWDGEKVSVRDRVEVNNSDSSYNSFRHTKDIIKAAKEKQLPDNIMFTFHPQRWTDKPFPWLKELIFQNAKNIVKRYLFVK